MSNLTQDERKQIAMTILSQLGGNKMKVMTGAKNMSYTKEGNLIFQLPRGFAKQKISAVEIALNGNDLYDIYFRQITNRKDKALGIMVPTVVDIKTVNDVFCEDLRRIFEEETGLYTSL